MVGLPHHVAEEQPYHKGKRDLCSTVHLLLAGILHPLLSVPQHAELITVTLDLIVVCIAVELEQGT